MYKHIFAGAVTMEDIIFIKNKCPKEDYDIIECVTNSIILLPCISNLQMNNIIDVMSTLKYQDDCTKFLNTVQYYKKNINVEHTNYNIAQTDAFRKIISTKLLNYHNDTNNILEKKCPHCQKVNSAPMETTYMICGIDAMGLLPIDNIDDACFNDWCFACEKKLCKNWYSHQLYNELNRTHNNECCKLHADKFELDYQRDYCRCFR